MALISTLVRTVADVNLEDGAVGQGLAEAVDVVVGEVVAVVEGLTVLEAAAGRVTQRQAHVVLLQARPVLEAAHVLLPRGEVAQQADQDAQDEEEETRGRVVSCHFCSILFYK